MMRSLRHYLLSPSMILFASLAMIGPAANAADAGDDATAGGNEIFGPQTYTREVGPPTVFTASFSHCGEIPAQIIVFNGNADGTNRVAGAQIDLNGVQV